MNIGNGNLHFDWRECLSEEIGAVLICGNVAQIKVARAFDMMSEPVIANIDVACTMLIYGVFEEGKRPLVVAVESDVVDWDGNVRSKRVEKLLCPDNVLTSFGASLVLSFCCGEGWGIVIHFRATPAY